MQGGGLSEVRSESSLLVSSEFRCVQVLDCITVRMLIFHDSSSEISGWVINSALSTTLRTISASSFVRTRITSVATLTVYVLQILAGQVPF